MSEIHVSCIDQVLKITSAPVLASGGKNEVTIVFDFCEKWDGYIKTATFYRDEENVYYAVLDDNDTCVVPWEVCGDEGSFYFSVFGEKGDSRRTANVVRYKVVKGAITEEMMPSDPTPTIYDQILGMVTECRDNLRQTEGLVEKAESAATTAEENAVSATEQAMVAVDTAMKAETIAKGRATGYVFDTKADMTAWLADKANTDMLNLGDNLYIRDKGVPDYWWDGEKEQELETQKVDLTEYVKNTDYATASKAGVISIPGSSYGTYGLKFMQDQDKYPGGIRLQMANTAEINSRVSEWKPIVPKNLDYAVHSVLNKQDKEYSCVGKPHLYDIEGDYIGQLRRYNCKEYDENDVPFYVLRVYMCVGGWSGWDYRHHWALIYESDPFYP